MPPRSSNRIVKNPFVTFHRFSPLLAEIESRVVEMELRRNHVEGLDGLKHIVVLMMENRSFDHMLGFLKKTYPKIKGLTGEDGRLLPFRMDSKRRV